jgi:16S rRNA (cytidine1402-2'-O)-methyltransferase
MSVFLIPCPILEGRMEDLPTSTIAILHSLTHFVVERAKTARHFLKYSGHPSLIPALQILEIDDQNPGWKTEVSLWIKNKIPFGIISEAGCPGIADPGAEIVAMAHKAKVKVKPLVGPSSIFLSLMSSGMSGQKFTFNGYLPNKKNELTSILKKLEKEALSGHTHIFMETPYRNSFIMEAICSSLQENTILCVACDITGENENIISQPVRNWKLIDHTKYHKRPCVFILGMFS